MLQAISICLSEGIAFVLTKSLNFETHQHNALQITISVEKNQMLRCSSTSGLVSGEVILTPPLVDHAFYEQSGLVLIILIDDEFVIAETSTATQVHTLEITEFQELKNYLLNKEDLTQLSKVFSETQFFKKFMRLPLDTRIKKLISTIKADENFIFSAENSARICHLSESRFLHLFKEELGIPFRKYIQWIKLRRALNHLKTGGTLTEAAYVGGFADAAHFSRYFKDTFGLNPSEIVRNSQFIQAK